MTSKRVIGRFQRPSVPCHELSLHPACVRKPREPTILGSLSGAVVGGTEASRSRESGTAVVGFAGGA